MSLNHLIDPTSEVNFVSGIQDCLTYGEAAGHRAILEVEPEALVDKEARVWFQAIRRIYGRGCLPEFDTIIAELEAMGVIKDRVRDSIPFLKKFSEANGSFQPDVVGRRINDLAQRRTAWKVFGRASEQVIDPMLDHAEIIQKAAYDALEIMSGGGDEPSPAGDDIVGAMEAKNRFAVDQDSAKLGWFGIPSLDQDVRASAGEFVIIAARPGKGKTALVIQSLCETVSDRESIDFETGEVKAEGHPCLFVSLELPKEECHARIASWFTLHRSGAYWAGKYGENEERIIKEKRQTLNRLFVWATPSRTPWSRIEAKIRGAVIRKKVRIVAIDYFGLIGRPEPKKGSSPAYEAGELSGKIRALAQQLKICIILLCQLNREGAEGEPGMEDLRETGQLEQDAQTILALYGGKASGGSSEADAEWVKRFKASAKHSDGATWVKILKNRNGPTGVKFEAIFDGSINHFARATNTTNSTGKK